MENTFKTPKRGPVVPIETVAVNDKWVGTPLGKDLQRQKIGYFMNSRDFGVVDFYISQITPVLYISQADLTLGMDYYKKKLLELIEVYPRSSIIVIADRNKATIGAYNTMVEYATIELEISVIPIGNQSELPQLLIQMAHVEARSPTNPFKQRSRPDLAMLQRKLIQQIPGVGASKVQLLFDKFNHVEGIANASQEELKSVIGDATADKVWAFFNENVRVNSNTRTKFNPFMPT